MPLSMPHIFIPDTSLITDPVLALTMMARTFALRSRRAVASSSTPPTFVAAGTVGTGSTLLSIPYYAGLAANDIAFVWVSSESNPTWADITDFTALTVIDGGNEDARLYWKRLTGGESGSVSVTLTGGAHSIGVMIGIRGAITSGTPYEGADSATGTGVSQTADSIVTTSNNTLALRFGSAYSDSYDPAPNSSPPSGWTQAFEREISAFAEDFAVSIDYKTRPTAGTEAASTRTLGISAEWFTQTLAVLPA